MVFLVRHLEFEMSMPSCLKIAMAFAISAMVIATAVRGHSEPQSESSGLQESVMGDVSIVDSLGSQAEIGDDICRTIICPCPEEGECPTPIGRLSLSAISEWRVSGLLGTQQLGAKKPFTAYTLSAAHLEQAAQLYRSEFGEKEPMTRIAIPDRPQGLVEFLLVIDGVDPEQVYEVLEEDGAFDRAFQKLNSIGTQLVLYPATISSDDAISEEAQRFWNAHGEIMTKDYVEFVERNTN